MTINRESIRRKVTVFLRLFLLLIFGVVLPGLSRYHKDEKIYLERIKISYRNTDAKVQEPELTAHKSESSKNLIDNKNKNAPKENNEVQMMMNHSRNRSEQDFEYSKKVMIKEGKQQLVEETVNNKKYFGPQGQPFIHCFDGQVNRTLPKQPGFVIIGAQKGGTTALFEHLIKHPNITGQTKGGNLRVQEGHFFDNHFTKKTGIRKLGNLTANEIACRVHYRYLEALFNEEDYMKPTQILFEKTPSYLLYPLSPLRFQEQLPWLQKFVVVLRNPVDRALSQFTMTYTRVKRKKKEKLQSFDHTINLELLDMYNSGFSTISHLSDAANFTALHTDDPRLMDPRKLAIIARGLYSLQLKTWLRYYSRESLLVVSFDEWNYNPSAVYSRILDFIGLPDRDHRHEIKFEKVHSHAHKNKGMSNTTWGLLEKLYDPYNAQLEELLGPEWKGAWKDGWSDKFIAK